MAIEFDPRLPGVQENPYPHYAQLRTAAPVHWSTAAQAWVLTRYADVVAVLRDQRFSAAARLPFALATLPPDPPGRISGFADMMANQLHLLDPPAHTRLRRLINAAFRPGMVEALRPRIQALVDGLLEPLQASGQLDVVAEFAYPLPVKVSAELLGLPAEDLPRLIAWADDFHAMNGANWGTVEASQRFERGLAEISPYLLTVIRARQQHPEPDLVTAFVQVEQKGERLSDQELLATCVMMLFGGHQSIRHMISVGLFTLLQDPGLVAQLRSRPSLIKPAVAELLRYDAISLIQTRVASEDVELGGQRIPRGTRVLLMLGAANRDPEQFTDPDQFNVARREGQHLTFGSGIHFCLGAALSEAVTEVALITILERLPNLCLHEAQPAWVESVMGRGLKTLLLTY